MFFRKRKEMGKFSSIIPACSTIEVAQLWDEESSAPATANHVAKVKLWSKIFEIYPKLQRIDGQITLSHQQGIFLKVSVSAAEYNESPFN